MDMLGGWRRSTRSYSNGNCVEMRLISGIVEVRDSKDRRGPILRFTLPAWDTFIDNIRSASSTE
jgi:hypothetical protein